MSVWNASNKICHFLRSSHWPMTKKLSAPKSVTHLVNKKVTDAELKESRKLRKQMTDKKKHQYAGDISSQKLLQKLNLTDTLKYLSTT